MATAASHATLHVLPFEIRRLIYKEAFGHKSLIRRMTKTDETFKTQGEVPISNPPTLLLVLKAIYEETIAVLRELEIPTFTWEFDLWNAELLPIEYVHAMSQNAPPKNIAIEILISRKTDLNVANEKCTTATHNIDHFITHILASLQSPHVGYNASVVICPGKNIYIDWRPALKTPIFRAISRMKNFGTITLSCQWEGYKDTGNFDLTERRLGPLQTRLYISLGACYKERIAYGPPQRGNKDCTTYRNESRLIFSPQTHSARKATRSS